MPCGQQSATISLKQARVARGRIDDQKSLKHDSLRSFAGLAAGFIVTISFGIIAYRLIIDDYSVPGLILGSIDLVALVTVFVLGRRPGM